ncbi:hypothetical protein BX600DRAFT_189880 [Xylariales sp. PMI_506]|nr:hypothetical protein BX600DRAFT_189880 [Xylariales sp. PMI_506]
MEEQRSAPAATAAAAGVNPAPPTPPHARGPGAHRETSSPGPSVSSCSVSDSGAGGGGGEDGVININVNITTTTIPHRKLQFTDLPAELRAMIWRRALPEEPRTVRVLVYAFPGFKLAPLNRCELRLTLAHVCFESRRVVRDSGYVLAFRDEDRPDDPGVWFHPKRDVLERTLWGPGEDWNLK